MLGPVKEKGRREGERPFLILHTGQWLETMDSQTCCEFHRVSSSPGWLQTSSVDEGGSEHLTFPPKCWLLVFQERATPSWD